MLTPSKKIVPSKSNNRNKHEIREDLPAPVLPTIPVFSPLLISKDTSFRTSGPFAEYFIETDSNLKFPAVGQNLEGIHVPRYFYNLGRRLAIVAGSSVLGGVSERISQTRKTRR
jgi:hypothetical protein